MDVRTVNLEAGMPTAAFAINHMNQELRRAKAARLRAVKFIHGWGSSGKGGRIKEEVQRELAKKKRMGTIKDYVRGEDFSPFSQDARRILTDCPDLARDKDYSRNNAGITVVLL